MFNVMAAGALLHGALAISGLFIMGLHAGDKAAMLAAIGSAGFAYLSQIGSTLNNNLIGLGGMAASVLLGLFAFVHLAL